MCGYTFGLDYPMVHNCPTIPLWLLRRFYILKKWCHPIYSFIVMSTHCWHYWCCTFQSGLWSIFQTVACVNQISDSLVNFSNLWHNLEFWSIFHNFLLSPQKMGIKNDISVNNFFTHFRSSQNISNDFGSIKIFVNKLYIELIPQILQIKLFEVVD